MVNPKKKDVGDVFIEDFARKHLNDRIYTLVYTNRHDDIDENLAVVGNAQGKDAIINLSNALFGEIGRYYIETEKENKDIFTDINNLKSIMDKIIYYL